MEALPAVLIEEILVRAAVKSLLRFKCVNRTWCGLIQSRRFIHRHYCLDNHQDRPVFGLLFQSRKNPQDLVEKHYNDRLVLPHLGNDFSYHHIGPVNGLLCVASASCNIVLLNPAMHKMKRVPSLPSGEHTLGFGFDPLSGDYKIVAIIGGEGEFVLVYNSSSDCWKRVEVNYSRSVIKSLSSSGCSNATFSNGIYYWVVEGMKRILAFDMMTEKFREIKYPEFKVRFIAAYGDSIGLMCQLHWCEYERCEYELWVMGKEGNWSKSWTSNNQYWLMHYKNEPHYRRTLSTVSRGSTNTDGRVEYI